MYYIGIDVGGMSIKGGICTKDGKVLHKTTVKTRVYDEKVSISEDIIATITNLLAISNLTVKNIKGIGIGQPGSVDSKLGIIRYSNNIKLTNIPLVAEVKKAFDVPVFLNNDANCAALGEYKFGSGKGFNDVVFVTLGTGVGSGIIINGKLFEGKACAGAEAGHTVIVKDGVQCNCGRKGCWEVYASASALIRQTKAALNIFPDSKMHAIIKENNGVVDGKTSFIASKAGDEGGLFVVNQYIDYVGEGLLNLANVFRPDVIIVGGGISHEGEYLTDKLNKDMQTLTYGAAYNPKVFVTVASLGNDAGILGAAALSM